MNDCVDYKDWIKHDMFVADGGPAIEIDLYRTNRAGSMIETHDVHMDISVCKSTIGTSHIDLFEKAFQKFVKEWIESLFSSSKRTPMEMSFSDFANKLTQLTDTSPQWNEAIKGKFSHYEGKIIPLKLHSDISTLGGRTHVAHKVEFLVV